MKDILDYKAYRIKGTRTQIEVEPDTGTTGRESGYIAGFCRSH